MKREARASKGYTHSILTIMVAAVALSGCASEGAESLFRKAEANCNIDHPITDPQPQTARAECVEHAGERILEPTLDPKRASAWQEIWATDILLAQQVDAGQITSAQAKQLATALRFDMLAGGR